MNDLTPEIVQRIWREGLEEHGLKHVDKSSSDLMNLVGSFLDTCGIQDKQNFMENFTTTVGETIYTPFVIGVPGENGKHSLWSQTRIFGHELTHGNQFKKDPLSFNVMYASSKTKRAVYEAEGYATDLEVHFWRYGQLFNIPQRMQVLRHYNLASEHIDFTIKFLEIRGEIFKMGGSVSKEAVWLINKLEKYAPGLKSL